MKTFQSIEEVAQVLGDGGPLNPDTEYETVEELVDALVDLGNTDKVFVRHDDHLGLKSSLSKEFLESPIPISENDESVFESDIEAVLEQANIIIPLFSRDLSDDDIEEIKEDQLSRGVVIDD
jgi:hypothetical protein